MNGARWMQRGALFINYLPRRNKEQCGFETLVKALNYCYLFIHSFNFRECSSETEFATADKSRGEERESEVKEDKEGVDKHMRGEGRNGYKRDR